MLQKPIADLLTFWRSRRGGRDIPFRSAFAPEEFKPWMGDIAICDVEQSPQRFRLRLIGEAVRLLDTRDYVGQRLDECLKPPLRDHVIGQWALSVAERKPVMVRFDARSMLGRGIAVEKLFLPMATDAGDVGQVFAYFKASGAWRAGLERVTLHDIEQDGSSEVIVLRDDIEAGHAGPSRGETVAMRPTT